MYALYKKYPKGYCVEVEILAYSEDKEELKALLPYEVERHYRTRNEKMLPHEMELRLPNGYNAMESYSTGAFGATTFEIQKVRSVVAESRICSKDIREAIKKNKEYLKSIGVDVTDADYLRSLA